jgi:protein involved in polysaccharide export with SLBB domain
VNADGTVSLGMYGSVSVVGLTLDQARAVLTRHLSRYFQDPDVSVDVLAYNSKVYYVITQGAGLGDGVQTFPVMGNETVLDAVAQVQGLEPRSSKRIWIARPTPDPCKSLLLPVNWEEITAQANPATNYQLLPGDRLFVSEDKWVAFDTNLAKMLAPLRQIMDFAIYGTGVATRFSGRVLQGGGARGSGFFGGSF